MNYLYNMMTSNYVEHWKCINIHNGGILGSIFIVKENLCTYWALNKTCIMSYIVCCTCLLPPDVSLTPHSLLHAVSTVRRFWSLGGEVGLLGWLLVPYSVQEHIIDSQSYSSEDEKRTAALQYYIETVPDASWGMIAGVLWYMEEHTALETVRRYLPHKPGEYTCTCTFLKW